MRRLQMLIQIRCLERVKLTQETDSHQKAAMLILWLLRLVVHYPVAGLVETRLRRGLLCQLLLQRALSGLVAFETGLSNS